MAIESFDRSIVHRATSTAVTFRKDVPGVRSNVEIVDLWEDLGRGSEGYVSRVGVFSSRAPEKRVKLAYKQFHDEHSIYLPYDQLFENYARIKEAGIPVPQTFRALDDEKGLLITDLTEDGKNVVASSADLSPNKIALLYEREPNLMHQLSNGEDIYSSRQKDIVAGYIDAAVNARLVMRADTWMAIIKPGGEVSYVACDMGQVSKFASPHIKDEKTILQKFNKYQFDWLWNRVKVLQQYGTNPEAIRDLF
jgi:hypothetical protein